MFHLLHSLPAKVVWSRELPAGLAAWVVAELFYKFHSFTLECAAFLGTWYVIGALFSLLAGRRSIRV